MKSRNPADVLASYHKFVATLLTTINRFNKIFKSGDENLQAARFFLMVEFYLNRSSLQTYDSVIKQISYQSLMEMNDIIKEFASILNNMKPIKINDLVMPYMGVPLPGFIKVCSHGHYPLFNESATLPKCPIENCESIPTSKTYFNGIIPYLVLALKDPITAKMMRVGPSKNDPSVIDSFAQGNLFKDRCFETAGKSDLHVYVSLFSDQFSLFTSATTKYNVIIALIDNLPQSERVKKNNRVTIYAYPTSHEEKNNLRDKVENINFDSRFPVGESDVSAFYMIIADHFKTLSDVGFHTYDANLKEMVRVYVHLQAFGGDIPAITLAMGHSGPTAVRPCLYCSIPKSIDTNDKRGVLTARPSDSEGKNSLHQPYDKQWYLNTVEPVLESLRQNSGRFHQPTSAEKSDLGFWAHSAVVHLKTISFPHSFPFDPMNIFFENITLMFYQISTESINDQIVNSDLREFTFSVMEKKIFKRILMTVNQSFDTIFLGSEFKSTRFARGQFDGIKTAQLEVLCYLMPIVHHQLQFNDVFREESSKTLDIWDIFADFSIMIKIANGKIIKRSHLDGIGKSFETLVRDYEFTITHGYKDNFPLCTLPIHLCTHTADIIAMVGPLSQFSGYTVDSYEEYNEDVTSKTSEISEFVTSQAKHQQLLTIAQCLMNSVENAIRIGSTKFSMEAKPFGRTIDSTFKSYQGIVERQIHEELRSKGLTLEETSFKLKEQNNCRFKSITFTGYDITIKLGDLVRLHPSHSDLTVATESFQYCKLLDIVECYDIKVKSQTQSQAAKPKYGRYNQTFIVVVPLPIRYVYSKRNKLTSEPAEKLVRCSYWYKREVVYDKVFVVPLERVANPAYFIHLDNLNELGVRDEINYVYDPYVACRIDINGVFEDVLTRDLDVDINSHLVEPFKEAGLGDLVKENKRRLGNSKVSDFFEDLSLD